MTKRVLGLLILLLALTVPIHAQQGNAVIINFPGAPSGSCSPISFAKNAATGEFYDCLGGAWHLVGGGGGGSTAFGSITSGTNTTAAMVVGSGATLGYTGSGTLDASSCSGCGVQKSTTVISSAQLQALPTRVAVIAAPGMGKVIHPVGIFWQYKAGATPYTIADPDNSFNLAYGADAAPLTGLSTAGFVDQATSQVIFATAGPDGPIPQTTAANAALNLTLVGTTPVLTLGDGTVTITVLYQIVTLQ